MSCKEPEETPRERVKFSAPPETPQSLLGPSVWEHWTQADWNSWIYRYLSGLPSAHPTAPARAEERFQTLIRFAAHLQDAGARERLGSGVRSLLECTQTFPANIPLLFSGLQVAAAITPPGVRDVLRQRIFDGTLSAYNYGGSNLQVLAISAYASYTVDEELASYLHVTGSAQGAAQVYKLLCLRLLIDYKPARGFAFIETGLLPELRPGPETQQLGRLLKGLFDRGAYSPMFQWFFAEQARLEAQFPKQWAYFRDVMASHVLPWRTSLIEDADAEKTILSAYLNLDRHSFSSLEIVGLTRKVLSVDRKVADDLMEELRRKNPGDIIFPGLYMIDPFTGEPQVRTVAISRGPRDEGQIDFDKEPKSAEMLLQHWGPM